GGTDAEKAERRVVLWPGPRQEVVGQLVDDEPIVGEVAVQGGDDPVPIKPGGALGLAPGFGDVGVAGEVEPVASPALPVMGRGEVAVDELRPGKSLVPALRGQAEQVEGEASPQAALVCRRGGAQSRLLQLRENEMVEARLGPGRVPHGWPGLLAQGTAGPRGVLLLPGPSRKG